MKYLSVCSGIEAASVAWHPLGWIPVGFSEIEPFPCAILKHRFPNTPNYGSLTEYQSWPLEPGSIDLLVGGCPCQSFSVAGLRLGMQDPRGNLTLTYLGLADKLKPKWIIYENVPGLLSSNEGRDLGSFLGALGKLGYGWAYRVLDAQYVGGTGAVPQRRRRVFIVACLGDWVAPAEVLSLREGLRGYLAAGGKKRKETAIESRNVIEAGIYENRPTDGRITGPHNVCPTMTSRFGTGGGNIPLVLDVPISFQPGNLRREAGANPSYTTFTTLKASAGDQTPHVAIPPNTVRKLTPNECLRLQGFPDNWTKIPWNGKQDSECPDGPQYKAIGNSMAVNCMFFIGNRIAEYEKKLIK